MIKTYKHNDNTQLSEHFSVQEFRCKCGQVHDFKVSEELISKLEALRSALSCSKIIVTSGFRCVAHDKSVGGSGTGQHTLGKAADIICYDQDGKPISSKIVCCKAQDIGFSGIANITAAYKYTHVDVRDGKWFGDEIKGSKSVTTDFYQYFDIKRKQNAPTTPTGTIKKGDKGDSVKWLQTRLAEKGYLRESEIDGSFGRITLGALLAFQMESGLAVDGACGPKTKAKLEV